MGLFFYSIVSQSNLGIYLGELYRYVTSERQLAESIGTMGTLMEWQS